MTYHVLYFPLRIEFIRTELLLKAIVINLKKEL
jgi:hypothetical protein